MSEPRFEPKMEKPHHGTTATRVAEGPAAQSLHGSKVPSSYPATQSGLPGPAQMPVVEFFIFSNTLTAPLSLTNIIYVIYSFPLPLAGCLGFPIPDQDTLYHLSKFPGRAVEVGTQ